MSQQRNDQAAGQLRTLSEQITALAEGRPEGRRAPRRLPARRRGPGSSSRRAAGKARAAGCDGRRFGVRSAASRDLHRRGGWCRLPRRSSGSGHFVEPASGARRNRQSAATPLEPAEGVPGVAPQSRRPPRPRPRCPERRTRECWPLNSNTSSVAVETVEAGTVDAAAELRRCDTTEAARPVARRTRRRVDR